MYSRTYYTIHTHIILPDLDSSRYTLVFFDSKKFKGPTKICTAKYQMT